MTRLGRLVDARRVRVYGVASVGLVGASTAVAVARGDPPFDAYGHPYAVDLSAHLAGGWLVAHGLTGALYRVPAQLAAERAILGGQHPEFLDLFTSPPFAALGYAPLSLLPYGLAAAIWTALTVMCLLGSLSLLWDGLPNLRRIGWGTVALAMLAAWPTLELLLDGQDTGLILFIYALGFTLLARGRDRSAGLVLALGAIKPQLVFLVPLLLWRQRRWHALASWSAGVAVLAGVSVVAAGPGGALDFLRMAGGALRVANADVWWKAQSLPSLLEIALPAPLGAAAAAVGLVFGAVLVLLSPWFGNRWSGGEDVRHDTALLILVTALSAPHFLLYDAALLVYPALVLLDERPGDPALRGWLILGWLGTYTQALRFAAVGGLSFPFILLAAPVVPICAAGMLHRVTCLARVE